MVEESKVEDDGRRENSFDTTSNTTPPIFVTPRGPILRSSPLSTKREKQARTPQFRRPAPRVPRTAPPMRSIYHNMQNRLPRLICFNGTTKPLTSPIYDSNNPLSFFEQCFKVDAVIGKGSFGEVFAVQSLEDSKFYAVKVSIQVIKQNCINKFREVENHMILPQHPNLVEFCRAWEEGGRLYIQQELCQKSLLQLCMEKHALPERQLWDILIDLLLAVDHLHSHDMVHDDIKPDNIFLTAESICKLGDFGLVINLRNPRDVDSAEEGDSKYLAPEVLNGSPSKASDIFSLGMTLLEAATDLNVPSNGESWHQIRNGDIPERFFVGVSSQMKYMIQWMLHSDPARRPTARQLLDQPSIRTRLFPRKLFLTTSEWPHTPIQTPEGSKVFARSLSSATPFDFSDDENTSLQRPRFPAIPRYVMEDDDDDEVPTSSSNSTATEFSCSPVPPSRPDESPKRPAAWSTKNGRAPHSARRLVLFPDHKDQHQGDGDFESVTNKRKLTEEEEEEERKNEQRQRYQRMMQMEACMDSDDNDAVVSLEPARLMPQSCPPMRSVRNLKAPRAPVLDFSVLDADKDEPPKKIATRQARPIRSGLRNRMIADQGSSADEI